MKNIVVAAVLAVSMMTITSAVQAQAINLYAGAGAGYGYGYQAGYNGYGRMTARRVTGRPIAPKVIVTEHPPGTRGQYRCDAATAQPATPGNAWCD
jgi:opacity protein-like surface antigen